MSARHRRTRPSGRLERMNSRSDQSASSASCKAGNAPSLGGGTACERFSQLSAKPSSHTIFDRPAPSPPGGRPTVSPISRQLASL